MATFCGVVEEPGWVFCGVVGSAGSGDSDILVPRDMASEVEIYNGTVLGTLLGAASPEVKVQLS